jgi:hypothetical protein
MLNPSRPWAYPETLMVVPNSIFASTACAETVAPVMRLVLLSDNKSVYDRAKPGAIRDRLRVSFVKKFDVADIRTPTKVTNGGRALLGHGSGAA